MPRKSTPVKLTNANMHTCFSDALSDLGLSLDDRTQRYDRVFVDGIALGDRQSEMRKPKTSAYEQTFTEANAVAHMAVDMELDLAGAGRIEVYRRLPPEPDTMLMVDGKLIAFVEQTMVMDQAAHKLTLNVEALNSKIRQYGDSQVRLALDNGTLTLRFETIPQEYYRTGLPIEAILKEIYALLPFLKSDVQKILPDSSNFPLLASLKTLGSYKTGNATGNAVMMLVNHGRLSELSNAFSDQLKKKRDKAADYPKKCRPLWLLLSIDMHFGFDDHTTQISSLIENQTKFERIIVQQTAAPLLVVDL